MVWWWKINPNLFSDHTRIILYRACSDGVMDGYRPAEKVPSLRTYLYNNPTDGSSGWLCSSPLFLLHQPLSQQIPCCQPSSIVSQNSTSVFFFGCVHSVVNYIETNCCCIESPELSTSNLCFAEFVDGIALLKSSRLLAVVNFYKTTASFPFFFSSWFSFSLEDSGQWFQRSDIPIL